MYIKIFVVAYQHSEITRLVWKHAVGRKFLAEAVADGIDRCRLYVEQVSHVLHAHPRGKTEDIAFVHIG